MDVPYPALFVEFYGSRRKNICSTAQRMDFVHSSADRNRNLAFRRPGWPACSRRISPFLSRCSLEYGRALENAGTDIDQNILSNGNHNPGSGRHLVSPQWQKGQWSWLVARCSPFDLHQKRFRLGIEPGSADFADSTALGWPTVGTADQHEIASQKAGDSDRAGRTDDQGSSSMASEKLFRVVADGFYATLAGKKLLNTTIISRIQRNAEVYDLPVRPKKKGRGRPRKKGQRVLCPQKLAKYVRHWQKVEVCERGQSRIRLVHSRVLLWYRVSQQPILLVISRDPEGKEKDDFFFTTDVTMSPSEVIECYADRWAIEDTFKNTKQYLGSQQPQTFKGQGPERAAGLSLWLYSMVWLWYLRQKSSQQYFMVHPWNPLKCRPSFADAIACLRRELWRERIKCMFGKSAVHDKKFEFLLEALSPAA